MPSCITEQAEARQGMRTEIGGWSGFDDRRQKPSNSVVKGTIRLLTGLG